MDHLAKFRRVKLAEMMEKAARKKRQADARAARRAERTRGVLREDRARHSRTPSLRRAVERRLRKGAPPSSAATPAAAAPAAAAPAAAAPAAAPAAKLRRGTRRKKKAPIYADPGTSARWTRTAAFSSRSGLPPAATAAALASGAPAMLADLLEASAKMSIRFHQISDGRGFRGHGSPRKFGTGFNTPLADVMEQFVIIFKNNPPLQTRIEQHLVRIKDDDDPVIVLTQIMGLYEAHLTSPTGIFGRTLERGNEVHVKLVGTTDRQPAKVAAKFTPEGARVENADGKRGKAGTVGPVHGCVELRAGACGFLHVPVTICERREVARLNVLTPSIASDDGPFKMALRCWAMLDAGASGVYYFKHKGSRSKAARAAAKVLAEGGDANDALLTTFEARSDHHGARTTEDYGWRHMDGGTGLESWTCGHRACLHRHPGLPPGGAITATVLLDYNRCPICEAAGRPPTLKNYKPDFETFGRIPEYHHDRRTRPLQSSFCYAQLKKMVQSSQITKAITEHLGAGWGCDGDVKAYPSNKVGTLLGAEAGIAAEYVRRYNANLFDTAALPLPPRSLHNFFQSLRAGLLAPRPWKWELTWDALAVKFCRDGTLQFCGISLKAHESPGFGYVQRNVGGGDIEDAYTRGHYNTLNRDPSERRRLFDQIIKNARKTDGKKAKNIISVGLRKHFNQKFESGDIFRVNLLREILGIPKELDGIAECVVMGAAGEAVHSINLETLRLACFKANRDKASQRKFCAIATPSSGDGGGSDLYFLCIVGLNVDNLITLPATDPQRLVDVQEAMRTHCIKHIDGRIGFPSSSAAARRLVEMKTIAGKANLVFKFTMSIRKKGSSLGITVSVHPFAHEILTKVFPCRVGRGHRGPVVRGGGHQRRHGTQSGGGPRENQLVLNIEENFDMEIMMQKKSADLYHIVKQRCPKFVNFLENYMRKNYKRNKVLSIRIKSLKNRPAWRGGKRRTHRRKKRRKRRKTRRNKRNKRKTNRKRRRKRRRKTR